MKRRKAGVESRDEGRQPQRHPPVEVSPGPEHQRRQGENPQDQKEDASPEGRLPEEIKPRRGDVVLKRRRVGVLQALVELRPQAVADEVDAVPGGQLSRGQKIAGKKGRAGLVVPEGVVRETPGPEKHGAQKRCHAENRVPFRQAEFVKPDGQTIRSRFFRGVYRRRHAAFSLYAECLSEKRLVKPCYPCTLYPDTLYPGPCPLVLPRDDSSPCGSRAAA